MVMMAGGLSHCVDSQEGERTLSPWDGAAHIRVSFLASSPSKV